MGKKNKYKFKGFDMAEIFEAANLEVGFKPPLVADPDPFTSTEEEDRLREIELSRLYKWASQSEDNLRKLEKLFRRYLKKFLPNEKKMHYHYCLWVGLSKIKDRETFVKYCKVLFWYMWN